LRALRFLSTALRRKPLQSALDTAPLRDMLTRNLNIEALRRSPIEIIISTVNLTTGRLHLYNQALIEIDHLMASSAMPIFFPFQTIRGEPYWDGGVMANSPLFIALEKKATEIIVVLLSPVGHRPLPPPTTLREGLELVFEHFLIGSYQTAMPILNGHPIHAGDPWPPIRPRAKNVEESSPHARISVIAPSRMLGFASILNFSTRQANRLISEGYHNARQKLKE